jgi:hypothetical protein
MMDQPYTAQGLVICHGTQTQGRHYMSSSTIAHNQQEPSYPLPT